MPGTQRNGGHPMMAAAVIAATACVAAAIGAAVDSAAPLVPIPAQQILVGLPVDECEAVDGDTVAIATTVRYLGRIAGIDTPERSKGDQRAAAEAVHRYVAAWLATQRQLRVEVRGRDKYGGRMLVRIEGDGGVDLAEHLIAQKLARPYSGQKKAAWTPAELRAIEEAAK